MEKRQVKITSDGTGRGTTINVDHAYAFTITGSRMRAATTANIFAMDSAIEWEGEAEIIKVPIGLASRAQEILDRSNNPIVAAAFTELFGRPFCESAVENVTSFEDELVSRNVRVEI